MELRQIQHFLAVVDLGNFHRAAEKVNLTQQAVSKSVRQLENQLGVRLLDRNRQSVSPTPFGELLLPHARAVDSEIRQFMRSLNAQLGIDQDVVRIGATPTPIQELLPKAYVLWQFFACLGGGRRPPLNAPKRCRNTSYTAEQPFRPAACSFHHVQRVR